MNIEMCNFCGKREEGYLFSCRRCGNRFCRECRLPENHGCSQVNVFIFFEKSNVKNILVNKMGFLVDILTKFGNKISISIRTDIKNRDKKRSFTTTQKQAIRLRQDYRCVGEWCGYSKLDDMDTEYHHIIQWSDDGKTKIENGVALCSGCHKKVHWYERINKQDGKKSEPIVRQPEPIENESNGIWVYCNPPDWVIKKASRLLYKHPNATGDLFFNGSYYKYKVVRKWDGEKVDLSCCYRKLKDEWK